MHVDLAASAASIYMGLMAASKASPCLRVTDGPPLHEAKTTGSANAFVEHQQLLLIYDWETYLIALFHILQEKCHKRR